MCACKAKFYLMHCTFNYRALHIFGHAGQCAKMNTFTAILPYDQTRTGIRSKKKTRKSRAVVTHILDFFFNLKKPWILYFSESPVYVFYQLICGYGYVEL